MARTETWHRTGDGKAAMVDVQGEPGPVEGGEYVVVSTELMTQMLTELGYSRIADED